MRALMLIGLLSGCRCPCDQAVRHDPTPDTGPGDTGPQDTGPGDTGDTGDTDDTQAPPATLHAGFRASRYGVSPFPEPRYWQEVGEAMAGRFEGAAPGGLWIVGVAGDDGTCYLGFPSPGGRFDDVGFAGEDQSEEHLDWFDEHGLEVWLQVEPGDADVATLIELVLDRYGHHPSVVGFGVDLEWYQWRSHSDGKEATDAEARAWRAAVQAYDPGHTLFLKHWLQSRMPDTEREGLIFVDDGQGVGSMDTLIASFSGWAEAFEDGAVGFQYGYESDRAWWSRLTDPPGEIGQALLDAAPNTRGLFWVDFTIEEVFPP